MVLGGLIAILRKLRLVAIGPEPLQQSPDFTGVSVDNVLGPLEACTSLHTLANHSGRGPVCDPSPWLFCSKPKGLSLLAYHQRWMKI
jgi:hypothetical protein